MHAKEPAALRGHVDGVGAGAALQVEDAEGLEVVGRLHRKGGVAADDDNDGVRYSESFPALITGYGIHPFYLAIDKTFVHSAVTDLT